MNTFYFPGCHSSVCSSCVCCNPCQGCAGSTDSNCNKLPIIITNILAVIGLFVGVFIAVVVIQRIFKKHLWVLQKQRLVCDFCVVDLADFCEFECNGHGGDVLVPQAPALPEKDVTSLQSLD